MTNAFAPEVAERTWDSGLQTGVQSVLAESTLGSPSQEEALYSGVPLRELSPTSSVGSSPSCVPGKLVLIDCGGSPGVVPELPFHGPFLPDDHPRLSELPPLTHRRCYQGLGTRDQELGTKTYIEREKRDTSTAELWDQIHRFNAGELTPIPVQLGALPLNASVRMMKIAEHMQVLLGLRLASDDERPLPYATSMAVDAGYANHKIEASRAITKLVNAGVIEHVGELERTKTKLYLPPVPDQGVDPFVEFRPVETLHKPKDQHFMGMTELASVSDGCNTTRNGASHGT